MNTATNPKEPTPRLPDIHLVVPPDGHAQAVNEALTKPALGAGQHAILAWRVAAQNVQVLSDDDLNEVMRNFLLQGHTVTVWHGQDEWKPSNIQMRVGADYRRLSEHLYWSKLPTPESEPNAQHWSALADELDKPDAADLRPWLAELPLYTHLPRWQLSDSLNVQGQQAFRAWVAQHLAPRLAVWDAEYPDDDEGAALLADPVLEAQQADDDEEDPFIHWPWLATPSWEARAWLLDGNVADQNRTDRAANHRDVVVQAGTAPAKPPITYAAWLHPVNTDNQYEAEQWQKKSGAIKGSTHVTIMRPVAADDQAYVIALTLPPVDDAPASAARWCLWLHPTDRLPLAFEFSPEPHATKHQIAWPKSTENDPDYHACDELWQAICKGSVSLDRLNQ